MPQHISFPPADAMTPEERAAVGEFAGAKVDTGDEAEGFALHRRAPRGRQRGATYSETSSAARAEGLDPDVAAELQAKADTLFKGESLRAMLLNAYGWWTLATIALWAGFAMVDAGLILDLLDPGVLARGQGGGQVRGAQGQHPRVRRGVELERAV